MAQVVEVGARDGLQNEPARITAAEKLTLLRRLAACGLRRIEATACVSPARVPQMADAAEVLAGLAALDAGDVVWSALAANRRGLDVILRHAAVGEAALFTAASDAFAERNIGCDIAGSLRRFAPLAAAAKARGLRVRGYISAVVECPYSGAVSPAAAADVAARMLAIGCDEISLGDTTGASTPKSIRAMLRAVLAEVPAAQTAAHFHDTCGGALANIACALEEGVPVIDAAVGGLGGCPFAPGAAGNVATEDVVYFLQREGAGGDGIDLTALAKTGRWICAALARPYASKAGLAHLSGE